MKQHIDATQLSQLNDKGKERLGKWLNFNIDDCHKLLKKADTATEKLIWLDKHKEHIIQNSYLSIGQMIWFLFEKEQLHNVEYSGNEVTWKYGEELCDALWSACLEVLNRE